MNLTGRAATLTYAAERNMTLEQYSAMFNEKQSAPPPIQPDPDATRWTLEDYRRAHGGRAVERKEATKNGKHREGIQVPGAL